MKNKLYALIVGIDEYSRSPLSGCVKDSEKIEAFLNSSIVTNQYEVDIKPLRNAEAERTTIIEAFQNHLGQAKEGDVAFFYFSGHGAQETADIHLWHEESDRKLEGLVCVDSLETKLLLADKELRFLIHHLSKNNPHIVTIFDCCHSGENTRGIVEDEVFTKRQMTYPRMNAAFPRRKWEEFCFHKAIDKDVLKNNELNKVMPQGNHIQLAACKSDQSAYETTIPDWGRGGVFTYNLLQILTRSRGLITYYDLKSRIQLYIKNQYNQRPTIYVRGEADHEIYKLFLGKEQASQPLYGNVVYNARNQSWIMDMGAMHGISYQIESVKVIDKANQEYQACIQEVKMDVTYLSIDDPLDELDSYQAYVDDFKSAPIGVYINGDQFTTTVKEELEQLIESKGTNITLEKEKKLADYVVQLDKWYYSITLVNDPYRPLVLPHEADHPQALKGIFNDLYHISQWEFVKQLHHTDTKNELTPNSIQLEFYDAFTNARVKIDNDEIEMPLRENKDSNQFKVKLTNVSRKTLHVAALYLGVNFEVDPDLMETSVQLLEPGGFVWLLTGNSNESTDYFLEESKKAFNWKSSTSYFKFIISTKDFDVRKLALSALADPYELIEPKKGVDVKRGIKRKKADSELWTTRLISFKVNNPNYNKANLHDLKNYLETDAAPFIAGLYLDTENSFSTTLILKDEFRSDEKLMQERGWFEFKMNTANWISRKFRLKRYKKKLKRFPNSIKIVSEGDSWFQYPHPKVKDIIDHLSQHYAIYSVGAAGDEVINYFKEQEYFLAVKQEHPDFLLLSGGGNDILGPQFESFLRDDLHDGLRLETKEDLIHFMKTSFFDKLDKVLQTYKEIFNSTFEQSPNIHILLHGYDNIIPLDKTDEGWLGRFMIKKNMLQQENREKLIHYLLMEFNDRVSALADSYPNVHYIDVRNSVTDKQWYDEIHPDSEGFKVVADKFLDKLKTLTPTPAGDSDSPLPMTSAKNITARTIVPEPPSLEDALGYHELITALEQPERVTRGGTSTRSLARSSGKQDLLDQFVVFSVPEDKSQGGIIDLGEVTPSKQGSTELPDALLQLEMLGFNMGAEENIKSNTRATMRLVVGQQEALDNQLEPLFWVIQAGLNLYNEEEGRAAKFKELAADLDKAFNKRYVEIPNGIGYLTFDVVKHEAPKWWQKVFKFLGSGVGQNLISVIGLPAITNTALSAIRGLFNELKEKNAAPLFKSRGLKLALTQYGKDKLSGGSSTLRVGTLNEGIFIMIRGRDYQFFKDHPAKYDLMHNMLVPADFVAADYFDPNKPNPFEHKTFALFRIRTKEVNLKENHLYFS